MIVAGILSANVLLSAPPFSATQIPGAITATTATLNGMASPNGMASVAWFEWSTNTSYSSSATLNYSHTTAPVDVGGGNGVVRVCASISGLLAGYAHRCRLVVSNAAGVTLGIEQHFVTGGTIEQIAGTTTMPQGSANCVAIAAGRTHNLALRTNGMVAAWGDNSSGKLNVPADLTNVIAIAAGTEHSLAVRNDGTVVAWGSNVYGQRDVPPSLSNAVAVAGGEHYSLALRVDGSIIVWGQFYAGVLNVPSGASNIVAISSRLSHILALRDDGTVFSWGTYAYGETNVPAGLSNAVAVAAGEKHSVALRSDGIVTAWGYHQDGQTNVPPDLTHVVAISAGGDHSIALKKDGTTVGWGYFAGVGGSFRRIINVVSGQHHYLRLQSDIPPQIVRHPLSRSMTYGTNVLFDVSAVGPSIAYQWQKDGTNLPFAANAFSYSIPFVTRAHEGNYRVIVSSSFGSAMSSNAQLRVRVPQQLQSITVNSEGGPRFQFSDAFGDDLANPANVEIQSTTNLLGEGTAWLAVTNGIVVSTNGVLRFDAPHPITDAQRYYRATER